jgi:hypothetical protein
MSKNNPAKKGKKRSDERLTANDAIFNEFILGDIVSMLLPIGITIFLKYLLGVLGGNIWFHKEWAFTAIAMSSLSLTRIVELKVIHQKDTSIRAVLLSRICVIFVILSTLCLALYELEEQVGKIDGNIIFYFQSALLLISSCFLYIAHYHREHFFFGRREFPENIPKSTFHWYLLCNLQDARDNIRATCTAFNKKYAFTESNDIVDDTVKHKKKELDRLIEDIQNDLALLQQRRSDWEKLSCADTANPEEIDDLYQQHKSL